MRGGPPDSQDITAYGVSSDVWQPPTGPYLQVTLTNYFKASSSAFAGWGRNNHTLNDDLHWVKGNHNFASGGHVELSKLDVTNVCTSYGSFGFNQAGSSLAIANVNGMANYQVGFMNSFSQGNYELVNDRNHFPGLYAQDSWKLNHHLTVDYGVRWEDFAPRQTFTRLSRHRFRFRDGSASPAEAGPVLQASAPPNVLRLSLPISRLLPAPAGPLRPGHVGPLPAACLCKRRSNPKPANSRCQNNFSIDNRLRAVR